MKIHCTCGHINIFTNDYIDIASDAEREHIFFLLSNDYIISLKRYADLSCFDMDYIDFSYDPGKKKFIVVKNVNAFI